MKKDGYKINQAQTLITWIALCATLVLTTVMPAQAEDEGEKLIVEGRLAYVTHCSRCHGMEGKGDGMDAKRLAVVPRNLTEGIYKFQSTEQGYPPSDKDLMWTLNHGMAGAGMPSFANLSTEMKTSIITYVKSLSPIFEEEPVSLDPPNSKVKVNLTRGKEVFDLFQCALCHGDGGRANGTSAFTINDSWGRPIRVANLTQGWTYRAGSSPEQIYYRLMAGINGAQMPSYKDSFQDLDDSWHLANYVASLQKDTNWKPQINVYHPGKKGLPGSLSNEEWKSVPHTDINMQSQVYTTSGRKMTTVNAVSVQASGDEQKVKLRIQWNDPTQSEKPNADSLMVALKPIDFNEPGTQNPHNLVQADDPALEIVKWTSINPTVAATGKVNIYQAIRSASNLTGSVPVDVTYNDGLWTLMLDITVPESKINADEHSPVYIGFSAWDGDNKETGDTHSASQWISLVLASSSAHN